MTKQILPGIGHPCLSVCVIAALLISRVALLPDGPWEQDEALFATGVIDYDVVHHRPHPPGFPGWIALGKLLRPLDALLALRLWSSLASVITIVVLAHLLAKLVPARVALLGALAYGFAPVTWAHAPRAFSDTPALACIVLAIWLWTRNTSRSSVIAWALVGFAATIRAQLVPELALVGALGLWLERDHRRRIALGLALAPAVIAIAYGAAALDAESPTAFWHAVSAHLARHESDVATDPAWADLGIVRGLGGSIPAAVACGLTFAGFGIAIKRDRKLGVWLLALFLVTAWMILGRHHPGFPRYAVTLLLVAMPPITLAVASLPRVAPSIVLGAAAIAGAFTAFPTMLAMHRTPLPPVAALRRIAAGEPNRVVYSHGHFSFVRYHVLSGELAVPFDDVDTPESIPALTRGAYALSGRSVHFLPGATVCIESFDVFPERARALSQERFDSAVIARDAILLGAGVHRPEHTTEGDPFAWLSGAATLHVPGPSSALVLQLRVPDEQRLEARVGTHVVLPQTELAEGPHTLRVPLRECDEGCAVDLLLPDARVATNDRRRLSLRIEAAWSEGPGVHAARQRWTPGDLASLRRAGVQIEGVHEPERFDDRPGAWTHARFVATFPSGPGTLALLVARPPHTPGTVVLTTEAAREELDIGREAQRVELRVDPPENTSRLEIATPTFVPRDVNPESGDTRELGLIVLEVEYIPDGDPCGAP